jgi:putative hemolysin
MNSHQIETGIFLLLRKTILLHGFILFKKEEKLENTPQNNVLKINVREILHAKAPQKKVPEFLIRYLERISHQDELNTFLEEKAGVSGIEFVEASVKFIDIKVVVQGLDTLPEGRFTFVGNHPLGGIDGLATGFEVYKRYPKQGIRFISNDLLTNIENLRPVFIPVNKIGNQSQQRSLPQRLSEAYGSDEQMVIFPAGICSRRIKGEITELQWQKSFISKSIESNRDVVPVYFHGRNSNFFYNLASLRKFFGIKMNVEMLYLSDEMFKQRGKTFRVIFGKPIPVSTFDTSKTHQEWADYVRELTLTLGKNSSL